MTGRAAALLGAFTLLVPAPSASQPSAAEQGPAPRIRTTEARIAALLLDGVQQSPTMRAVVDQVEAGKVVVYVRTVLWLPREHVASVAWIGVSAPYRFVRVSLKAMVPAKTTIARLAHELEHVLEVQGAPSVTDELSLRTFYEQIGFATSSSGSDWETAGARWIGEQVLRELNGPEAAARAADVR